MGEKRANWGTQPNPINDYIKCKWLNIPVKIQSLSDRLKNQDLHLCDL